MLMSMAHGLTPRSVRQARRASPRRPIVEDEKLRRKVDVIGVIDFECTCEEGWGYHHEIIEFPIVVVDCAKGEIVDEFHSFVKPSENATLSAFCTKLTGIDQPTVDASPELPSVLDSVDAFLRRRRLVDGNVSFALATDGWDLHHFLDQECKRKNILKPGSYLDEWVDLAKAFDDERSRVKGRRKPAYAKRTNMSKMLRHYGMTFQGRKHSGRDDARNLALLALALLNEGVALRVNDALRTPSSVSSS